VICGLYYSIYINDKPTGVVRIHPKLRLICGNEIVLKYFKDGEPDYLTDMNVIWEPICGHPSHPALGKWIDYFTERKTYQRLSNTDKAEVLKLKSRGVKARDIAHKFGVSQRSIERIGGASNSTE